MINQFSVNSITSKTLYNNQFLKERSLNLKSDLHASSKESNLNMSKNYNRVNATELKESVFA